MQEMRVLIRHLSEKEGKTVFLSSHLLHEVEQVCDRVLILNKGQVIAQGEVKELLRQAHALDLRIDEADKAAKVLSSLDWVQGTSYEGDWLHVQASPERAPELLAALASHSLYPFEVRPVGSTLENVFLDLTNESEEGVDA
jgi:ABC-2 type transport system ATP-binding protein